MGPLAPPVTREFLLSLGETEGGESEQQQSYGRKEVIGLLTPNLWRNPQTSQVRWGEGKSWTGAKRFYVTG